MNIVSKHFTLVILCLPLFAGEFMRSGRTIHYSTQALTEYRSAVKSFDTAAISAALEKIKGQRASWNELGFHPIDSQQSNVYAHLFDDKYLLRYYYIARDHQVIMEDLRSTSLDRFDALDYLIPNLIKRSLGYTRIADAEDAIAQLCSAATQCRPLLMHVAIVGIRTARNQWIPSELLKMISTVGLEKKDSQTLTLLSRNELLAQEIYRRLLTAPDQTYMFDTIKMAQEEFDLIAVAAQNSTCREKGETHLLRGSIMALDTFYRLGAAKKMNSRQLLRHAEEDLECGILTECECEVQKNVIDIIQHYNERLRAHAFSLFHLPRFNSMFDEL